MQIALPEPIWCARKRWGTPYAILIIMACVFVVISAWIVMFAIRVTVDRNRHNAVVQCTIYNITRIHHRNYCKYINMVMSTDNHFHTLYGTYTIVARCDSEVKNRTVCYKYNGELLHWYPQSINITALNTALIITGIVVICGCIMTCLIATEIYCEGRRAADISNALNREIMLDNPHAPTSSMDYRGREHSSSLTEPMLYKK